MKKPDPFMIDDDNPEWTEEDFARAKPLRDFDPGMIEAMKALRKVGRPAKDDKMVTYTIKLEKSDVEKLRAKGSDKTRELLHLFANA